MLLNEAKAFVGKTCAIRWQDRAGCEQMSVSMIYDVTFVPLYGGYVVTDTDDIRLDRVVSVCLADTLEPATAVATATERVAA